MIVRNLKDSRHTQRRVATDSWESVRLLLRSDGMGFSFHVTTIYAGTRNEMWYKNHLEAVFCTAGRGVLEELDSGRKHTIEPGVIYALDKHDQHVLSAEEDLTLICAFNPPLNGREVHDADGAYALEADSIAETD